MSKLDKHFQAAMRRYLADQVVSPRNAALWNRYLDPANTDREMEEVAAEFEREWPDPFKYKAE